MGKLFRKIRDRLRQMKLRQRMILVYIVGGMLPLLFVYFYMFRSFSLATISRERTTRTARIHKEAEELNAAMEQAWALSNELYFDENTEEVVYREVSAGYRDFDLLLTEVEKEYPAISNISVYFEESRRVDNWYYKLLTDTIRQKEWYIGTYSHVGLCDWSYTTAIPSRLRSLRMSKVLRDTADRNIGVISISLKTGDVAADAENGFGCLLYNNETVINGKDTLSREEVKQIAEALQNPEEEYLMFRGQRCSIVSESVRPRYSFDEYTIVTLRPFGEIVSTANRSALQALVPMLFGAAVMGLSVWLLTDWFDKRMKALTGAMEEVTTGGDVTWTGIGDTKDEIWDLYNDLQEMVTKMQQLTLTASKERLEREQLYSRQRDVEFKMLSAQINPHFLYNTLETIRMLALIDHENEIADIAVTLTKLLRGSLEAGGNLRPLSWELEMVRCYIKIQDYRFGDRIHATIEDGELTERKEVADHYLVLPFVLQPFVENAYVHAMEEMEEGGDIRIGIGITDQLLFYVEDNGKGMETDEVVSLMNSMNDYKNLDRTHIGIANVNQRIRLRFGEEYGVQFRSAKGKGTRVEIRMPLLDDEKKGYKS